MGKTKEHSEQNRGIIIDLKAIKIPRQTVDYIVKKFASEGTISNSIRQGTPRATLSEDLNIVVKSKRNRRLTAPEIPAQFNLGRDKPVSVSTIKRRLLDAGLKGYACRMGKGETSVTTAAVVPPARTELLKQVSITHCRYENNEQ
ncbi:hypothetical protein SFRURICE_006445 [Spodoptera frugiperda]|uniref:SFRICE_015108 n=1 Tax=Spodoptera frugiperda TaxID=7108 RepID=A0A2H1WHV7_SPOFR|nr:hypothetical protein SFRURICE_006445 [Spodoptera frugiperda]